MGGSASEPHGLPGLNSAPPEPTGLFIEVSMTQVMNLVSTRGFTQQGLLPRLPSHLFWLPSTSDGVTGDLTTLSSPRCGTLTLLLIPQQLGASQAPPPAPAVVTFLFLALLLRKLLTNLSHSGPRPHLHPRLPLVLVCATLSWANGAK